MGFELSRLLPLIGAVAYWFMKHARSSHALIYRASLKRAFQHFAGRATTSLGVVTLQSHYCRGIGLASRSWYMVQRWDDDALKNARLRSATLAGVDRQWCTPRAGARETRCGDVRHRGAAAARAQ